MLSCSLLMLVGCDLADKKPTWREAAASTKQPAEEVLSDEPQPKPVASEVVKRMSADDPVEVRVTANSQVKAGEKLVMTVAFEVDAGYEIQSFRSKAPKQPTKIDFKLPAGLALDGELQKDAPKRSKVPGNGLCYSGHFECKQVVQVVSTSQASAEQVIECSVSYQACDDKKCLRPARLVLKLPIKVVQ
jgi:hypothetical protein